MVVLGASARAAAWSALRAGLMPSAADLFADQDLAAVAACSRVDAGDYPEGLIAAAESLPPGPWFYTGALENRPDLIERLGRTRVLWGNGPDVARAARDPVAVTDALRSSGFGTAQVRLDPTGLPRDGSWLRKPLASGGGLGIEPLTPESHAESSPSYYQERLYGPSFSAVFVGTRTGALLAGITLQWTGRPGEPFAYRGSLTPWPVAIETGRRIAALGPALASRFGLVGLFGVDMIVEDDGEPCVVEVNPRYTASVEVIELSSGRSLVAAHRLACEGQPLGRSWPMSPVRTVAKEVLYAEREFVFEGLGDVPRWEPDDPFRVPNNGDVPRAGTRFGAGDPVATVFGKGTDLIDVGFSLAGRRALWQGRMRPG